MDRYVFIVIVRYILMRAVILLYSYIAKYYTYNILKIRISFLTYNLKYNDNNDNTNADTSTRQNKKYHTITIKAYYLDFKFRKTYCFVCNQSQ